MNTPKADGYAPVMFNPQDYAAKRSQEDAALADAYSGLQVEFAALDVLLQARRSAGLTQSAWVSNLRRWPALKCRWPVASIHHRW